MANSQREGKEGKKGKRKKGGNKSPEPTKSQSSPINQRLPFSPVQAQLLLAGEQNSFQLSVQEEIRDVLEKGKKSGIGGRKGSCREGEEMFACQAQVEAKGIKWVEKWRGKANCKEQMLQTPLP